MRYCLRLICAFVLLDCVLLAAPVLVQAQDVLLPADKQAQLMMSVLGYTSGHGDTDEVVLGVVYQDRYRASRSAAEAFAQAVRAMGDKARIWRLPVRVVMIEAGETGMGDRLERAGVSIAYVAPLRGIDVGEVQRAASRAHVSTFTAVPDYVERGVMAGATLRGNRPEVLLNLATARADGRVVNPQLLRVARVLVQ